MIKGNETEHIYMQVQRNTNLINTIQAICNNKLTLKTPKVTTDRAWNISPDRSGYCEVYMIKII